MTRPWIGSFPTAARLSLLAAALALVAACSSPPPPYRPTAPSFAGAPVFDVSADRVEVVEAPDLKRTEPPALARLAADPVDVAKAWPKQRLKTDPSARGTIVYRIEEAQAVERYLPRKTGVTAAFTSDPEAEFNVSFAVTVTALGPNDEERGAARAQARAGASLKEGADEDERRMLWERLMRQAAERLDAELQKQVPVGLQNVLRAN